MAVQHVPNLQQNKNCYYIAMAVTEWYLFYSAGVVEQLCEMLGRNDVY